MWNKSTETCIEDATAVDLKLFQFIMNYLFLSGWLGLVAQQV